MLINASSWDTIANVISLRFYVIDSINRLYCRCAELTEQRGYSHFGLQSYGECWSGPSAKERYAMQGKSDRCIGVDYKPCVDSAETECIGKDKTNYIYELVRENSKYVSIKILHLF